MEYVNQTKLFNKFAAGETFICPLSTKHFNFGFTNHMAWIRIGQVPLFMFQEGCTIRGPDKCAMETQTKYYYLKPWLHSVKL